MRSSIKSWALQRSHNLLYQVLARACSQGITLSTILTLAPHEVYALASANSATSAKSFDQQVVKEFRAKLKQAEDLIGKLAFSLKEIQDQRTEMSASLDSHTQTVPGKIIAAFSKKTT